MGCCQTKISSFFGSRPPVQDSAPASHSPSLLEHLLTLKIRLTVTHVVDSVITPGNDVQDADRAELMIISDSD